MTEARRKFGVGPPLPDSRWLRLRKTSALVATLGFATPAVAGGAITPFTSEAPERGLFFELMPSGQQDGYLGFGCGFADLDGDGDADVIVLGSVTGRVGIFENLGRGLFADRTLTSGIPNLSDLSAFATADYDGDGKMDLYLSRVLQPGRLFRGAGDFTFSDVTSAAGVNSAWIAKCVCWGDYDNDGWVDLYVCNYRFNFGPPAASQNQLWHNNGDGTFTNVAAALGVNSNGASLESVWTDFDRDGDLDLYLSNDRGDLQANQLFRNNGNGTFVDVAASTSTNVALDSMGLACGDFDGDGFVDFYCTNTTTAGPVLMGAFPLLLSQGDGTFVQAQEEWHVAHPAASWGWGATFFDWNNDGHRDLYVCNQADPNSLFQNDGAPPATNVALAAALGGPSRLGDITYCASTADVDGDGDIDLLVSVLGSAIPLYINHEGEKRSWVTLRVIGDGPNTAAIGANAEITTGESTQFGEIYAGGNNYLGQNEQVIHFGLGRAKIARSATVRWPSNGPVRTLTSMPAGARWTIYPPSKLGDGDRDGDVDAADRMAMCAAQSRAVVPGIEMLDFNGDFVIDAVDLTAFRARYEASGRRWSDLDVDGNVNASDLALILGAWGTVNCSFDLNGDGTVDAADLSVLLGDWG